MRTDPAAIVRHMGPFESALNVLFTRYLAAAGRAADEAQSRRPDLSSPDSRLAVTIAYRQTAHTEAVAVMASAVGLHGLRAQLQRIAQASPIALEIALYGERANAPIAVVVDQLELMAAHREALRAAAERADVTVDVHDDLAAAEVPDPTDRSVLERCDAALAAHEAAMLRLARDCDERVPNLRPAA